MDGHYFDSKSSLASQPLQNSSDTSYHNSPFLSSSRRSSGRFSSATTPPLPSNDFNAFKDHHRQTNGTSTPNGGINNQDLTPSLHASLVSEILALRRDLDSKDNFIDRLESIIADERGSNEVLNEDLKRNTRETKTLKRQLQSIETSTLTALEDLCKERDVAVSSVAELRKKFEVSQKELKAEQEHIDASFRQWEQEKTKWEQDKRQLLRKNEIAESRLQAVVSEVAEAQASSGSAVDAHTSPRNDGFSPLETGFSSNHSSPKHRRHRRNQSSLSTLASAAGSRHPELSGLTLEDELNAENDDEPNFSEEDADDHAPPVQKARDSRASAIAPHFLQDAKARKILGMPFDESEDKENVTPSAPRQSPHSARGGDLEDEEEAVFGEAVAFKILASRNGATKDEEQPQQQNPEVEANQRRKRDPLRNHSRTRSEPVSRLISSQADSPESLPSPPASPKSIRSFVSAVGITPVEQPAERPEMVSSAIQTDQFEPPKVPEQEQQTILTPSPPPITIEVPSIAIHPPADASVPSSPLETVLPPGTKSLGTQTASALVFAMRSAGVQTDIIRIDRRPIKLPPHLLPSALKDPEPERPQALLSLGKDTNNDASSLRSISPSPSPTEIFFSQTPNLRVGSEPAYDSVEGSWARLRRSLLHANKHSRGPDPDPFMGEDVSYSDGDYVVPVSANMRAGKRQQRNGRPSFDPPTPVPEDEKVVGTRSSVERPRVGSKSHSYKITSKAKHVRTPSNNASQRSASPSSFASSSAWSKMTGPPPIAIPRRTSSAGIRQYRSSGASSPTRGSGASSSTKRYDAMRVGKKPSMSLRKVWPSIATPSDIPSVSGSLPMSPWSRASFASAEMSPPPTHGAALINIRSSHGRSSSSQTRRLSSFLPTGNASAASPTIQHTVVDAIAQTMVGEWMWKYVRKRKSFGLSDNNADSSKTGDLRHKRWVWLSPYERTVMWSTKQPNSNAALLGKNGRTLTIQSVLDVKDDNVSSKLPRNVFNRSILVLTPTRALKFTAVTRERHYLWLTALSFLAHHTSHGSLDLSFLPLPPGIDPPPNEDSSRNTSRTQSRSSRKPWSSMTRSRHSSGYATPSVPEASAIVESSSLAMPPRPNRPAPALPPEHYFPDTALAPNIPRVPGSSSGSRFSIHGRKRSQSITGIMTSRSSNMLNHSGTSSLRSVPTATTARSSNHSIRSGYGPNGPNSVSVVRPPLPSQININYNFVTNSFPRDEAQPPLQPKTPTMEDYPNPLHTNGNMDNFPLNASVPGFNANGNTMHDQSEFGGNNSFFDAAGARKRAAISNGTTTNAANNGNSFEGPGLDFAGSSTRDFPLQMPAAVVVPKPVSAEDAEAAVQLHHLQIQREAYQHQNNASVDSVAPPPIQRRGAHEREREVYSKEGWEKHGAILANGQVVQNGTVAAAIAAANKAVEHAANGTLSDGGGKAPRRKWF